MEIWHALIRKLRFGFFHSRILMGVGWMVALVGHGIWRSRLVILKMPLKTTDDVLIEIIALGGA